MTSSLSPALLQSLGKMLEREEGRRTTVYDDATGQPILPGTKVVGHPTIGIGRALDVNGLSDEEINYLLANDVEKVVAGLDRNIPWWRRLSDNRKLVLIGMAFQMGLNGLLGFRNTLRMMERGDYAGAAQGMLASLWARQTPDRARRMADLMRNG